MSVRTAFLAASLLSACLSMPAAYAAGTITDGSGDFTVGIGANGELFDPDSYTGFQRNSDGFDPLEPGTPRDSWGISAGSQGAFADSQEFGTSGVTSTLNFLANSATVASKALGLDILQEYAFAAPNVLKITTTVANLSGATIADVAFQRNVDWEIAPTEFTENTVAPSIAGFSNITQTTSNGFENPDPTVPYGNDASGGVNSTGDLGAGIKIALGDIANGASKVFSFFYAIADGVAPAGLTTFNMQLLGSSYNMITQSSENGNWPGQGENYAILGFGGTVETVAVPLPAAGAGLPPLVAAGLLVWRRRRASI